MFDFYKFIRDNIKNLHSPVNKKTYNIFFLVI
jgi:hypothetical protein